MLRVTCRRKRTFVWKSKQNQCENELLNAYQLAMTCRMDRNHTDKYQVSLCLLFWNINYMNLCSYSLWIWAVKTCKIQRENILKRPILRFLLTALVFHGFLALVWVGRKTHNHAFHVILHTSRDFRSTSWHILWLTVKRLSEDWLPGFDRCPIVWSNVNSGVRVISLLPW